MPDIPTTTAYRFKWSNVDRESHVENCRFKAAELRRQAAILTARADQIDEEAGEWSRALVEVENAEA